MELKQNDALERKRAKFDKDRLNVNLTKSVNEESFCESVTEKIDSAAIVRKVSLRGNEDRHPDTTTTAATSAAISKILKTREGFSRRSPLKAGDTEPTKNNAVIQKEVFGNGKGVAKSTRSGDETIFVPSAKYAKKADGQNVKDGGTVGDQVLSDDFREYFDRATGLVEKPESVDPGLVVADSGQESAVSPRRNEEDDLKATMQRITITERKSVDKLNSVSFEHPATSTRNARRTRAERGGIATRPMLSFRESSPDDIAQYHAALSASFAKKDLFAARKILESLLRMHPECQVYRFNFGLTLKIAAVDTLRSFRADLKKVSGAVQDLELAQNTFEMVIDNGDDSMSKEMKRAIHEAKVCSDILRQTAHLVYRSDSCSSLGSSGKNSIGQPLTFGDLSPDDNFPRRRNGSGSTSLSRKREALAQRGSDKKDKLVKRQQEPVTVKKRSRKSAQLEEHYNLAAVPLPEIQPSTPVIEPQRKRARAVKVGNDLAERRRKRVANRKRRELEIEKTAQTSSDDETVVVAARPLRRKADRSDENISKKERHTVQQRASLTSDSDSLQNHRKSINRREHLDDKPTEELGKSHVAPKPTVLPGSAAVIQKLSTCCESSTEADGRETESDENRSSAGESDDSIKRAGSGSGLEGKSRKRKTLVRLN